VDEETSKNLKLKQKIVTLEKTLKHLKTGKFKKGGPKEDNSLS
jgi:hypothetical protein